MPTTIKGKVSFAVFVIRNFQKGDVVEDEIIKIGEDRYRSIKFRYTYYKAAHLFRSEHEAYDWIIASRHSGSGS